MEARPAGECTLPGQRDRTKDSARPLTSRPCSPAYTATRLALPVRLPTTLLASGTRRRKSQPKLPLSVLLPSLGRTRRRRTRTSTAAQNDPGRPAKRVERRPALLPTRPQARDGTRSQSRRAVKSNRTTEPTTTRTRATKTTTDRPPVLPKGRRRRQSIREAQAGKVLSKSRAKSMVSTVGRPHRLRSPKGRHRWRPLTIRDRPVRLGTTLTPTNPTRTDPSTRTRIRTRPRSRRRSRRPDRRRRLRGRATTLPRRADGRPRPGTRVLPTRPTTPTAAARPRPATDPARDQCTIPTRRTREEEGPTPLLRQRLPRRRTRTRTFLLRLTRRTRTRPTLLLLPSTSLGTRRTCTLPNITIRVRR